MSQENVEVVRRATELLLAGGFAEYGEVLDPAVEWDLTAYPLPDWPDEGKGREAYLGQLRAYVAGWRSYEAKLVDLLDAGDDVMVTLHERVGMPDSDMTLERRLTCVFTLGDDGRMCRMRVFKTRDEALKAVGLEE
jgi:ketosteroid isomerase-like protein